MSESNAQAILNKSPNYLQKSSINQNLIAAGLNLLVDLGFPIAETPRRLERMVLAFLAVANITEDNHWQDIRQRSQKHFLKTRDIIQFVNQHFQESISSGSYDDIRRKDLKLLITAHLVLPTEPQTARNNPNRAYKLNPVFAQLIQYYKTPRWEQELKQFLAVYQSLIEELSSKRGMQFIPVKISHDAELRLTFGEHNELQKAIVEEFLPRYGYGAEVLYLGDAADKYLLLEEERLKELRFFEIGHGELPDIIAYSAARNWLYLIEAVHSSGAIDSLRLRLLKELSKQCEAEIIFVTAFFNRATFRKFVADIAWETEVWIAEEPDHLIHFDGEKFLGPYTKE
jgi:hypothetical protein